jgi:hypothetical protein
VEDIQTLKNFIDNSGLSSMVKKALFDCLMLEMRKSPTPEYLRVIKQFTDLEINEN